MYLGEVGSHCETGVQMLDGHNQKVPNPARYQSEMNSQDFLASSAMVIEDVQTSKPMGWQPVQL